MAGQWVIEDSPGQWVIEDEPIAVTAGKAVNSIPRQLGLTARYALEGPAQAAQVFTEPIASLMRLGGIKTKSLGEMASGLADTIGLPSPQDANERVIGDATRLVAGAGGFAGAARSASSLPDMAGKVFTGLASNPMQQLGAAAGAGLAGGSSREAGGSGLMQAGGALVGGVLGGMTPGAVSGAVNAGRRMMAPALTTQQLDIQLTETLGKAGANYSELPGQVQRQLRAELAASLQAGKQLDPQAVSRLADFRTVGATPTRGMVSQNPVQITREMNLAKTGANSNDEVLQGLAMLQNRNNARLIAGLNDSGASKGDQFRAGQEAIGGIRGRDAAMESGVSALYQQARDTSGRSANLDGAAFTTRANAALDEAMVGGALPPDVAGHMNRIARGEVPFTVDYAEQLKTRIGALQRATNDGSARMALGTVRRALDETPLMQAPKVNPGNLPAAPGTVPPSPSVLGRESINAFNQARTAARERFGWQESGRPIEAALNGAQPDKFVQQFVINGTLDDARAVAQNAPVGEVKNAIVAHLKEKALNGASDEIGKFSQSAYNKAMNQIGDRKLALYFTPEEIGQLKATGRVASYMQNQPTGSAVNNSNSGALLLGRGMDLLNKTPLLGPMVGPALKNIDVSVRQRQAQNYLPGLLRTDPKTPPLEGLMLPGLAMGGGLLSP